MKTIATFLMTACLLYGGQTQLITPLEPIKYDDKKAQLGKKLFFETRLSKDNTISCATCHALNAGGVDRLPYSFGVGGKEGNINAPTVLNSGYSFVQFWDGRAKDLQQQAKGPIENPVEMALSHTEAVERIKKDPGYKQIFGQLYPQGVTIDTIADALAEFEKALVTPNSRFDKYLKGDINALNSHEKEGYELFKNKGCISCHNGAGMGGNMFQKFGIFEKLPNPKNQLGRYDVTKKEKDKYFFKVPSLRNIAETPPYFHTGSVKTLEEAVELMAKAQLGIKLGRENVAKIVLFLKTLTGEQPQILKNSK